jgi:uroporphyrinogen III methyltransferase/synthase
VTVYLVGAGPGDPGLLTVRGAELLAAAHVVVYDRLAAASMLDLVPVDAERVYVGKGPGQVELTQEEINALLVDRGRAGLEVVRLKGGDPFVFGRGGEEAEALMAAGVPFEVVPGVTSAIAAPAYAGIPVTHRGLATSVTIVTGHEDPAKGRTDTDWHALARTGGTLVILMGAGHWTEIAAQLLDGGLAATTPVAAVRWGTRAEQQTVRGTLGNADALTINPPSAIVVGDVAALDFGWFEQRPLFGRTIVVTRAREQASELRDRLHALGAEVLELPSIALQPIDFTVPDLAQFAWLVFTSANGVAAFFHRLDGDARSLAGLSVAAIGPGTAGALRARGVRADLVPERFVAESLVDAFPAGPGRVLLARAETARDVLPDGLADKGWQVDVLAVYRTVQAEPDHEALERVRSGAVDAVTFTSSSTVTNFCDLVGDFAGPQPLVACIGPVTAQTAKERGLRIDAVAEEHTIDGLVSTLLATLPRA